MAVRIRLQRVGRRNHAQFRMVVMDQRKTRDGRCLEILGWYDPHRRDHSQDLKLERIEYWVSVGAQPSDTARRLINRFKRVGTAAPVGKRAANAVGQLSAVIVPEKEKPVEEVAAEAPVGEVAQAENAEEKGA